MFLEDNMVVLLSDGKIGFVTSHRMIRGNPTCSVCIPSDKYTKRGYTKHPVTGVWHSDMYNDPNKLWIKQVLTRIQWDSSMFKHRTNRVLCMYPLFMIKNKVISCITHHDKLPELVGDLIRYNFNDFIRFRTVVEQVKKAVVPNLTKFKDWTLLQSINSKRKR